MQLDLDRHPLESPIWLLRAIETRQIRRVGSDHFRQVDFRLLAATNRDLPAEIAAGRFRQDLYWRLSVLERALALSTAGVFGTEFLRNCIRDIEASAARG